MSQDQERSRKPVALILMWGAMFFSFMIRYALGVAAPTLMKLYHLTPKTMGYILAGWNWSYTGALTIVGPIMDRFGPYLVMTVGSTIWGVSTFALPIATGAASLIAMRMIFGFGDSILIASVATTVSRIFSAKERTRAIAIAYSGNDAGLASGAAIATFILARSGWPTIFYCIGGASLLLTVAWFFFYPDKRIGRVSPAKSSTESGEPQQVSWGSLFRHRSTWGTCLGTMGYLYVYYFFVSWLPTYLVLDRKMTLLKTGVIAALPFWMGLICTLGGGWLGDYLIQRGVSRTVARKSIIGVGLTTTAVMLVTVAFIKENWLDVTLIILIVGCLRSTTGSINSLPIDLAPLSRVGSLCAIQNFSGNVGGILAPILTGYVVSSTGSFLAAFVLAAGMAIFGAICFTFVIGDIEKHRTTMKAPALAVTQP